MKRYYGMTTATEQAWCESYIVNTWQGSGEIVELGPWMGALTIPLATGLLRRKMLQPEKKVHVFDRWIWEQYMEKYRNETVTCKVGESFKLDFMRNIGWLAPLVDVRGDLYHEPLFEKPVELLVVDAMKSWKLTNIILRNFYTRLLPETGYVFHQDYMFSGCPWLHMAQWLLRDFFWVQQVIPFSTTVVFRCHAAIPGELFVRDYDYDSFSKDDIKEAFKYSRYTSEQRLWGEIDKAEEAMIKGLEALLKGKVPELRTSSPREPLDNGPLPVELDNKV